MKCKICHGEATQYAEVTIRRIHRTAVFQCHQCDFVFLDPITWLAEAYADPINTTDVGYVQRNLKSVDFLAKALASTYADNSIYCDYGAGYGLFVRLMRDKGYRFHWHDPYCKNLFASYCEASLPHFAPYTMVTAFEVFEHLPDPMAGLQDMLRFGSQLIFTTELVPGPKPQPGQWWYFGLDHGQHVSFYSRPSLEALAARFGLKYHLLKPCWHLFGTNDQAASLQKSLQSQKKRWFHRLPSSGPKSLMMEDFQIATKIYDADPAAPGIKLKNIDWVKGLGQHRE